MAETLTFSEDEFAQHYEMGEGIHRLCKKHQIPLRVGKQILAAKGIHMRNLEESRMHQHRSYLRPGLEESILAAYDEGQSARQIVIQYHTSSRTVGAVLLKNGRQIRTVSQSMRLNYLRKQGLAWTYEKLYDDLVDESFDPRPKCAMCRIILEECGVEDSEGNCIRAPEWTVIDGVDVCYVCQKRLERAAANGG